MKFEDIQLSGSLDISGSMVLPLHAEDSDISNPIVGDLYFNTVSQSIKVYNGTGGGWQVLADQTGDVASADIEYLVVAGGGGGSAGFGNGNGTGGGGAGGYQSFSLLSIESGSSITVTVGGGGAGGTGTNSSNAGSTNRGANGSNSSIASAGGTSFTTVTSTGGGSGGRGATDVTGNDGGSGGGGGAYSGAGGSGTTGQGNDGGTGTPSGNTNYRGGGGGGKSAAGATGTASGNGGSGEASSITGTSTFYAGGGGGGCYQGITPGTGGTGGGGAGSAGTGTAGDGSANTGGGGGGGGWPGSSATVGADGGDGGSGVVILAYPTASISATGGVRTFFNDRVAHIFESSNTFAVGGIKTYTHNTLDVFGDSSCVALYNLDGNANDTGGTHNGTASNVTYAQSYINQGGVFNGSSSYIYAASSVLSPTTNYSVSVWCKWSSKPSTSVGLVGNFKTGVSPQVGFVVAKSSGENTFSFWADGTASSSAGKVNGTTNFSIDTWYHVVGTYDGSNVKIYVNGQLEGTQAYTATPGTTDQPLVLGRWYGNYSDYYFPGKLDQIRIFNKALTASEVTTLYAE